MIIDLDAFRRKVGAHFADDVVVALLGEVGSTNVFDVSLKCFACEPELGASPFRDGLVTATLRSELEIGVEGEFFFEIPSRAR